MHSDRLTRQELTWLLTQEASSAAEKLRQGVAVLASAEVRELTSPAPASIESELDALDDAMKTLASLHSGAPARGRRGRIDLAALLWEVAPNARVSIEPGSGTEVCGDENELRRMLQLLVGSTSATSSAGEGAREVSIRREGDEVSVSVALGPDSSAHAGTERAWLGRMAARYGGRLVLDGAAESIRLPADGADEQLEVETLRRELFAAQRHGESCARELARVFSSSPPPVSPTLNALTMLASSLASQLGPVFATLEREIAQGRDVTALADKIAVGSDVVYDLARLGRCSVRDTMHTVDLGQLLGAVVTELQPRATRRSVSLSLSAGQSLELEVGAEHLALLVRTLTNDALLATPPGGAVTVAVHTARDSRASGSHPVISIEDGGPPIGIEAYERIVAMQIDPSSVGRPSSVAHVAAHALAQHLGAMVVPADSAHGRMDVSLLAVPPGSVTAEST